MSKFQCIESMRARVGNHPTLVRFLMNFPFRKLMMHCFLILFFFFICSLLHCKHIPHFPISPSILFKLRHFSSLLHHTHFFSLFFSYHLHLISKEHKLHCPIHICLLHLGGNQHVELISSVSSSYLFNSCISFVPYESQSADDLFI